MAAEQVKSQSITNSDAIPPVPNSAGQGGSGRTVIIDDTAAVTAVGIATTKSFYRILRIPTEAILVSLQVATDRALDSGTPTLALDFSLAWADGTTPNLCPLAYQLATLGLAATEAVIPTTANDGRTTTTIAAYSAANVMFGTVTPTSNSAALAPTFIEFNGSRTNYPMSNLANQPLWQIFGFVDGRSNPADPGGYFDLIAYVSTAANVGVAGNLYARLTYSI